MKRALAWVIRIIGLTLATLFWGAVAMGGSIVLWILIEQVGPWGAALEILGMIGAACIVFGAVFVFLFALAGFSLLFDWATDQVNSCR